MFTLHLCLTHAHVLFPAPTQVYVIYNIYLKLKFHPENINIQLFPLPLAYKVCTPVLM